MEQCKKKLVQRGDHFADFTMESHQKIVKYGDRFIRDGSVVLTHGHSPVVNAIITEAVSQLKQFSMIVCEGRPDGNGFFFKYIFMVFIFLCIVRAFPFSFSRSSSQFFYYCCRHLDTEHKLNDV